jgi:3-oxoacyl-[acyl-carrier protein] reductase
MLRIKDSVAVITGGGSGIGESIARCWAEKGGRVVIGDIDARNLKRVEEEIKKTGGEVATVICDVTSEDDNKALAELAIKSFGSINLVVPAAGIIKDGMFLSPDRITGKVKRKMSLEQFESVVNINLTGVFLTIRECGEQMINNDCKGLICLISSTGSLGTAGQLNYSSTKAAMAVMPKVVTSEFFRRNLSGKIRCVAVAPGYVATKMVKSMGKDIIDRIVDQIPVGRLIEPEEVASLVFEIYRNEAMAGEVYFIHGGLRLGSKG